MLDGSCSDSLKVAAVPMAMIESVWDKVSPLIERVIARAPQDLCINKVKDDLMKGNSLLLTITDDDELIAFFTLETQVFPTGHKVMYVAMMSGDGLDRFINLWLDVTHKLAREYKCDELRISGRKGWIKKLKAHNWYEHSATISCKVREE